MERSNSSLSKKGGPEEERFFSVEMRSNADLKGISLTTWGPENVLVEGTIGILQKAEFAEGVILEIVGSRGILRINIGENEIKKVIKDA